MADRDRKTKPRILNTHLQALIAAAVLFLALLFLVTGVLKTYKVYSSEGDEYGIAIFYNATDMELTEDATFHGVILKNNKLYSTYNRLEEKTKRPCPT